MATHEQQKERILEAALEVVYRETIVGTRMHLIAKEAGVVKSNIHYHFNTKKELLLALFTYTQKNYYMRERSLYEEASDLTLQEFIRQFFLQKKNFLLHYPKYDFVQFSFWTYAQIDEEIHKQFYQSYAEWQAHIAGLLRGCKPELSTIKANMAAELTISLVMGGIMQYFNDQKNFDLDAYYEACTCAIQQYLG